MTGQHRSGGTRAGRATSRGAGPPKGRGRRYLTAGLLWLLVVGATAVVAWIAIGSASRSVTAVPLSADNGDAGAGPGQTGTGLVPASGAEGPGTGHTTASSRGGPAGEANSPTPSATGSSASLATRTFRVTAGVVTASCLGTRIQLVSAAPTNGWSMVVDASGPGEVEVEFARASAGGVKVEARCAGGIPSFTQELEGPGGGGSSGPGGGGSGSSGPGGGGGSSGPGGGGSGGGGDD